jgi:hypothetical protein
MSGSNIEPNRRKKAPAMGLGFAVEGAGVGAYLRQIADRIEPQYHHLYSEKPWAA